MRPGLLFLAGTSRRPTPVFLQETESAPMQSFIRCAAAFGGQLAAVAVFVAILNLTAECSAQRPRGLFGRVARIHHGPSGEAGQRGVSSGVQPPCSDCGEAAVGQASDWRRHPSYYSGDSAYPKFIGGFHISQYYNLGVPSGDIGFGFNGIYWTPW
jgi:hypothetical protein